MQPYGDCIIIWGIYMKRATELKVIVVRRPDPPGDLTNIRTFVITVKQDRVLL